MDDYTRIRRLDPLSDPVFSCIFADESTTVSMLEIINAVLEDAGDEPIKSIVKVNSQYGLVADNVGKKSGRLDVRAVAESGELFDIEVQLQRMYSMNDRAWFYGSRMMNDSFREGEKYDDVPRVRVINILDFKLREGNDDFLQPIGVMYKKPPFEVASDAFRIYNIELPKFIEKYDTLDSIGSDPLKRWLYLFEIAYKDEHEMEVLTQMSEGLRAFAKKYNRSIDDPQLRRMYEYDLSAKRDEYEIIKSAQLTGLRQGLEKGTIQGRKEGKIEGKIEAYTSVIRAMLSEGLPSDIIYKLVDAPRSEIDEIVAGLGGQGRD